MGRPLFPEVRVDGETIPHDAIAAEAQNHTAPASKPGWAWHAAARALVVRRLLEKEATRRGLLVEPRRLEGGRIEAPEEAAIRVLLDAELPPHEPDETEIRAIYDADPERFRSPALFEAAHILYAAAPEDEEALETARHRAGAALVRLMTSPAAFGRIAAEESACSSREAGGQLGQTSEGDLVPEMEAVLMELAPGQIAPEPVETRYGVHVVRLDARADGAPLPFETVRPRIFEALERRAWVRAARAYVARLVAAAEVEGTRFVAP